MFNVTGQSYVRWASPRQKERHFNETRKMQLEVMSGTRKMQLQDLKGSKLKNLFAASRQGSPPQKKYVPIERHTYHFETGAPSALRCGPRTGPTRRRTPRRA